ncbi:MAG: hypothetical protein QXE76_05225 [Candidatus Bathyarchaeia archaeon]
MPNGRNWHWHKHGWWCPRHPWPPPWARIHHAPYGFQYPFLPSPMEELEILETMKKDLEENMKRLESRIKELRETVEKEKRQ